MRRRKKGNQGNLECKTYHLETLNLKDFKLKEEIIFKFLWRTYQTLY